MLFHLYARPNGALVSATGTDESQMAANAVLMGLTLVATEPVDPAAYWWDGEVIAPRLAPPAPPALTAGVEAVWAGLEPGAVVTVDPMNGAAPITAVASDGTLSLTLPVGPWRISVNEAFPALAAMWDIEVAP